MIDSKELRKTNLVLDTITGEVSEVCSIGDRMVGLAVLSGSQKVSLPEESIDPIPLTEEWLEKFGFVAKYKSVNNQWTNVDHRPVWLDQAPDVDDYGREIEQKQEFFLNHYYEIKYVHQLQNLYFTLTQHELTIKDI